MRRYVPDTYNNRRALRVIIGIFVSLIAAAAILFVSLFFGLWKYVVYTDDGIRLEIPILMDAPAEEYPEVAEGD